MEFRESMYLQNSSEQIKYRKSQNALKSIGMGIIMFYIWSVIEGVGYIIINKDDLIEDVRYASGDGLQQVKDSSIFLLLLFTILVVCAIILVVTMQVGFSALKEGKGKRGGIFFIPMTIVMILFIFIELFMDIYECVTMIVMDFDDATLFDIIGTSMEYMIIPFIIELTIFIMLIHMLVSVIRVRRYRKMVSKEEENAA